MTEQYSYSNQTVIVSDSGFTYGQLCQKNSEYDEGIWKVLDDLYVGGFQMMKNSQRYLSQLIGESQQRYQERLGCASYVNYLAQIIDEFAANVFSQEISVTPAADAEDESTPGDAPKEPEFYSEFQKNADLNGTSYDLILRKIFTSCILKQRAILCIDLPATDEEDYEHDEFKVAPSNLADEEELGTNRAYVFELPVEDMYDWCLAGPNHLEWCVIHKKISNRKKPGAKVQTYTEEFKIWSMDEDEGVAKWEIWTTPSHPLSEKIPSSEQLTLKDSGVTSFKAIPVLFMEVPESLWVGNRLGTLALEHFQRRSALCASENRSLFAVPYLTLGSEIGAPGDAIPSEVQQDPHRGDEGPQNALWRKGYMVLGKDDTVKFAEPLGTCYEIVDRQLTQLVDEMFRVTHHMSSSVAASKGMYRSAKSKIEDRHAMEIVLSAFGTVVRQFTKHLFNFISTSRGDDIIWQPHGMDTYELEDRDLLIKEATFVDSFNIPSRTFRKVHKTKLAFAFAGNVPTATKTVIRDEIAEGVDDDTDHLDKQDKLRDLILEEQIKNPDVVAGTAPPEKPQVPGVGGKSPGGIRLGKSAQEKQANQGVLVGADSKTHHPHRVPVRGGSIPVK